MDFTGERLVPGKVSTDLYHEHFSRYRFASQFITDKCNVIDIGCGAGYGSYELSKYAQNVLGIDIATEAIEFAKTNYQSLNLNFQVSDCRDIHLRNEYDVAVSFEVIEHIDDIASYLNSVKSTLKEMGTFIVSTPNKKMYSDAIEGYNNPFHIKEFYFEEFNNLLNKYFKNVHIYTQDFQEGLIFKNSRMPSNKINVDTTNHNYEVNNASFFIAVCSDGEIIDDGREMLFTFTENNILAEKDKYIEALKHEVKIRDDSVGHLQNVVKQLEQDINIKNNLTVQLENSAEFIKQLKHQVDIRDISVAALKKEIDELNKWVKIANEETKKRDESIAFIQAENNELKKMIKLISEKEN